MQKNLTLQLTKVWVSGLAKQKDGSTLYLKKDGKENSVVVVECHVSDENPSNKGVSKGFYFGVPTKTSTLLNLKEKGLDLSKECKKPVDITISLSQAVAPSENGKFGKVYYKPSRLIYAFESNKDSQKQELPYSITTPREYSPLASVRGVVYFGPQTKKDGTEVRLNEHTGVTRFVCNPTKAEKETNSELESTWISIPVNDRDKDALKDINKHDFTNAVCQIYHTTVKEGEYENKYFALGELKMVSKIEVKPKETTETAIDNIAIDDSDLPF